MRFCLIDLRKGFNVKRSAVAHGLPDAVEWRDGRDGPESFGLREVAFLLMQRVHSVRGEPGNVQHWVDCMEVSTPNGCMRLNR